MEEKPSRAKRRISSNPFQGFCSRFSRSTRCAAVSLIVFAIEKKKPTASSLLAMGLCVPKKLKKRLGQQFPSARRHECTTTTTTHAAHALANLAVPHH